jgi:hypothetical protein
MTANSFQSLTFVESIPTNPNHTMKKFSTLAFIFTASALIFSCHHVKDLVSDKADPKVDYAALGYAKGFVTDVQLDGCKWMIQLDSAGKRIEPEATDWPPGFQQDSLLVWVKYVAEDRMSICMAGQTVHIEDIKKR